MRVLELIAELEDFDTTAEVIVRAIDCGDVVQTSDLTEVRRLTADKGDAMVLLIAEIPEEVH